MKPKDNKRLVRLAATLTLPLVLPGCSDELHVFRPDDGSSGLRFELQATIDQKSETRADDTGFADGDRFGLFVVNYSDGKPTPLTLSDNQVNNVAMTYSADANKWQSATDIYWRDPITPADVYGYYPFFNGLSSTDAYSFEVRADQSVKGEGEISAYEASDFLWAKTAKAQPGKKVELTFGHVMAGVKVILQQGSGFDGDAWTNLEKTVTVDNTIRSSEINLSTGTVTPVGSFDRNVVMNPEGDAWRAVVVPQTVAAGKSNIGITIDGKPYAYTRSEGMKYAAGKLHTFTIKIDRKGDGGDYSLTLVDEAITPWEADQSSHDFESNSYLVVHVAEPGTLNSCLEAMHVDAASLRNIKVTGQLNDRDFNFIREEMSQITAINMKGCKMGGGGYWMDDQYVLSDDVLPSSALSNLNTLRKIVLPETLKVMSNWCLSGLTLSSTVIIPDGVKIIEDGVFGGTSGAFTIVMSDNIEKIGDGAFNETSASIDLKLPKSLKYIGFRAFAGSRNIYGSFALPSGLVYLGQEAFDGCGSDLEGDIVIPEGIKVIPQSAFNSMGFKKPVSVSFHDGVTQIGSGAFRGLKFSSPVVFPKGLTSIGSAAFVDCQFVGDLILPDGLSDLGKNAFSNTNIKGTVEVPVGIDVFGGTSNEFWINYSGPFSETNIEKLIIGNNVEAINSEACVNCEFLRYVSIGKNVSFIGENAFASCPAIETIICLAPEPPRMDASSFAQVDLNHCVVEVPESAVEAYRRADGWNIFRSITPHHELNLSLSELSCLNKGLFRSLMVRAEGSWEISECPDWIHVSPDHSDYKEEINVSIDPLAYGRGYREGKVVFRLKESGYANYLTIRQYDYEFEEDKEIVIQRASGDGMPIPVVIVGEGYGAESIVNGEYLRRVNEMVESFFSIEPYKTYRNMFEVSTTISLSPDDGAPDILSSNVSKFGFTFPTINCPMVYDLTENLKSYIKDVFAAVNDANIGKSLIVMLSNYEAFAGGSYHCDNDDCAIACVGISSDSYPYDNRGLIQNVVGGEAFGGLASEQINHFEFIKGCTCPACSALPYYHKMKERGLFENVTISGKSEDSPWRDFIYHPKYSALVDMYEGGFNHLRGVWRSEPESVMSNYIPYYNTISRYAIYKQIMKRAGLPGSLEDFINNDKIEIPN